MGEAIRIPRQLPSDAEARLRRLRRLAWFLDRSVGVGDKARFGLDPVVGLIPVVGDWVGGVLALYVIYEALRLGVSWRVMAKMLGNVGVEVLVGAVPVVGDLFDFYWQASTRNLRLVERHYHAGLRPRSNRAIALAFSVIVIVVVATLVASVMLAIWLLKQIIELF